LASAVSVPDIVGGQDGAMRREFAQF